MKQRETTIATSVQGTNDSNVNGNEIPHSDTFIGFYQVDASGRPFNFIHLEKNGKQLPKDFDTLSVRHQVATLSDALFTLLHESKLFGAKVFQLSLPVFVHFHVNGLDETFSTSKVPAHYSVKFKLNKLARTQKQFASRLFFLVSRMRYEQRVIDMDELISELNEKSANERMLQLAFQDFCKLNEGYNEKVKELKEASEENKPILKKELAHIRTNLLAQFNAQKSLK